MPLDPLGGRIEAPSDAAPYRNALTVTRNGGDTLPVIPTAFYLPGVLGAEDEDGAATFFTEGGQNPYGVYKLRVEMQNGEQIEMRTAGLNAETGATIIVPLRIRKILWDQSDGAQAVTLLW